MKSCQREDLRDTSVNLKQWNEKLCKRNQRLRESGEVEITDTK